MRWLRCTVVAPPSVGKWTNDNATIVQQTGKFRRLTMTNAAFQPHGSAHVTVDGQVMTVHLRGDWNAEMRAQTAQEMMQLVPSLQANGAWGIVNVMHDTLIYSESIYAQTRSGYANRSPQSQLCAVAFVIGPRVEGASLLRPRFESLLQGILPCAVFSTQEQALVWMQMQLAAAH